MDQITRMCLRSTDNGLMHLPENVTGLEMSACSDRIQYIIMMKAGLCLQYGGAPGLWTAGYLQEPCLQTYLQMITD